MEKYELFDNTDEGQYEYRIGKLRPHIEYKINNDGVIFLTHTGIPEELRGQGVGTMLVADSLEDIDRRGLKLVPLCGFVAAYIKKNPEWMKLLKADVTIA